MKVLLRSECGLQIPAGLTMPVRRCHICGETHWEDAFEVVEVEGEQAEIPGPPEDLFVHWAHRKWEELNRYSGNWDLKRFNQWRDSIGCGNCKAGLLQYLASEPFPHDADPDVKLRWGFDFHNWVNRKLGKPEFPVQDVAGRWNWWETA